ncbi:Cytochrome oxidase biogenesis protein Sco1/SenC/PrrC, thiol-disulfide reductase involved in Cu(I) insertion into CoxII Cu(A) center [hydrothermal vent metagenome]|uniref:Cytochrome oxidase biogenesis protein Sco1/SenC/PrrC, thiol-disulfide reductase involved in Cu(I) insertion into CoxII Cu(A) center n=1 Tax=hydrothermal vent metagenome TaxID=652676 RepID=A0A3B0WC70_9ZZZZ
MKLQLWLKKRTMPVGLSTVNNFMNKHTNITGLLLLLLIAGVAGFMASRHYFSADGIDRTEFQSLLVYPNQKTFSGFELTNQNGESVTIESFAGKWTLLFFGFTFCPDVCPTTLTDLQKVFKILRAENLKDMPDVLFISVDPKRDTIPILKDYISFFDPAFNAATGDAANILALATQIGVAYHIEEHPEDDQNYDVNHTAAIFLVNPEQQMYGIFQSPHDVNNMALDLTQLIGHNKE